MDITKNLSCNALGCIFDKYMCRKLHINYVLSDSYFYSRSL